MIHITFTSITKKIFLGGIFLLFFIFNAKEVFAQVVINEFLPNPAEGGNEWVELYNLGNTAVGLSGWSLSDSTNPAKSLDILIEVPAKGFAVYIYSGDGWLNNSSDDSVTLKDNLGATIDSYSYTSSFSDNQSMGRCPDGSTNWVKFDTSSQSASNPVPTPIPTSVPTAIPTLEPTVVPTSSPTNTPTPTLTLTPTLIPTPKPTAIPTIKPTPTFGIVLEPTESLGPDTEQTGDFSPEGILGAEASPEAEASSSSGFAGFMKSIPWFPVLAIGAGVLFVTFSLFMFLKANKSPKDPLL